MSKKAKQYITSCLVFGLVLVVPIFGLKYQLVDNKLVPVRTQSNSNGDLIDQKTLIEALLANQYEIERIETEITKKNYEIMGLKREFNELKEDYNRFKKQYFRNF